MATPAFYIVTSLGRKLPVYTSGIPESTNFSVSEPVEVNVADYGGTRVENNATAISFGNISNFVRYAEAVRGSGAEYLLPNGDGVTQCLVAFSSSPIPDPLTSTKGIYGSTTSAFGGYTIMGEGFSEGSPLALVNLFIDAVSSGGVNLSSAVGGGSARVICSKLGTVSGAPVTASSLKSLFVTEDVELDIVLRPTLQYIEKGKTIQFNLFSIVDGVENDVTSLASWGLGRNTIDEPVSELDGFTISSSGLLTAIDPTVSSIIVSAKFGGLGQYTTIYTSKFPGIYYPGGSTGAGGGSTGGGGAFGKNEVSDQITVPSGSVAGNASSTGMFTRYLVNSSYLDILGDWLWADDLGLQIAKTVISAIYGNPAESVISLMSYPFNINSLNGVTTRRQNLFWGSHDSGLSFIALTSHSGTVDWGTITLEEYWGNFLDYEPHTKIELYLPWGTGFVSIDPNMCLPGTLRVVTNIDFSKGSCVHNVIGNNGVCIGTYAGQCSQQIPILSNDYASKVAGIVVSATALAVAATSGGGAISAGRAAEIEYGRTHSLPFGDPKGTAEYLRGLDAAGDSGRAPYQATQKTAAKLAAGSSIAAFKRTGIISRNGSFTDGSAALGVQYPYIILSRPSQSVPEQYGSHYGYPSNIYTSLGNIRGYTEVGEIHLDGIPGTDAEIAELDAILKGGVIF